MKKITALLLTVAMATSLSATALGAGGNGHGNKQGGNGAGKGGPAVTGATGASQDQTTLASTGQELALSSGDQTVRQRVKDRLRQSQQVRQQRQLTAEEHKQKLMQLKDEVARLQAMHRQAAELRRELNGALQALHKAVAQAQGEEKWQALKKALPQIQAVSQRVGDVRGQYQESEGALEAFQEASGSKDLLSAVAAIQDSEVRVQTRIEAMQQVLDAILALTAQLEAAPADPTAPADGTQPQTDTQTQPAPAETATP